MHAKYGVDVAASHTPILTEQAMREIAEALEASAAMVLCGALVGGAHPTGVTLTLGYEGDDVASCGKDILFWLRWNTAHGSGARRPPRFVINRPGDAPQLVRLELDFGHVEVSGVPDGGD